MEFGSIGGREDGERSAVAVMEIPRIFVEQDEFVFDTELFDRI